MQATTILIELPSATRTGMLVKQMEIFPFKASHHPTVGPLLVISMVSLIA
jgi:hypothetical protein